MDGVKIAQIGIEYPLTMDEANGKNADAAMDTVHRKLRETDHSNLTADPHGASAWERVKTARHPERPYTLDYVGLIFAGFVELHGDRRFGDDAAIISGMAKFQGEPCAVVGHQKGRTTKQKMAHNFGSPNPEGYRKALRVMKLAEKFGRPVFTFIDTAGAYPGIEAEERGQAEAIASNLKEMAKLRVPVIVTVTGEGGSGGALAIGVGDIVLMLENSVYSVISPEGCSAILWRDREHMEEAARALRLTSTDLLQLGLIDQIVPEPPGGAHTDHREMAEILSAYLADALSSVRNLGDSDRVERRYDKFRAMGDFFEGNGSAHANP